jgi:hypothetical protein
VPPVAAAVGETPIPAELLEETKTADDEEVAVPEIDPV